MNTNYDLRKALYAYLDVKFDSGTQIDIAATSGASPTNKFKAIKVDAGSIVNIFISAQNSTSATSISLNALGLATVNEYYSDFLIKVYWTSDNIIYISNDSTNDVMHINSIHVEFLKGKLIETYLIPSNADLSLNTDLTPLTAQITIDSSNVGRVNYKRESLTFKSEYTTLSGDFVDFENNYDAWKLSLGLFSQVDKLVPDSNIAGYFETYPKHKKISEYIDDNSIHGDLIIPNTILYGKLSQGVKDSLDLADRSVQSIKLNGGSELNISAAANIEALTTLKIYDKNDTPHTYNIGITPGEIAVDDLTDYMQSKLSGNTGDLLYFNEDNVLSNIPKSYFLLKANIVTDWTSVDDDTVPSSLLVSTELATKIDIDDTTTELVDISLVKVSVNAKGLVTGHEIVDTNALTTIIGNYYLTTSYQWNSETGVLKLL